MLIIKHFKIQTTEKNNVLLECYNGTYGLECVNTCGNCIFGSHCHHVDGACLFGCAQGFLGTTCKEG